MVTFVMTKIYIDVNGAGEYGLYISLHVYLLLIGALAGSGFGIYGLKEFSVVGSFDYGIFKTLCLLVALSVLLFSPALYLLKLLLDIEVLTAILCMGQYAFSSFLVEVLRYQLGGNSYLIIKDVARSVFVCLFLIIFPGISYETLILLSSSLQLCIVLLIMLFVLSKVKKTERTTKTNDIVSIIKQGMTISIANGFQTVKSWADLYAATLLLQPGGVALYSICQKLGQLVKLPLVALNADIAKRVAKTVVNNEYPQALKVRVNITRIMGVLFSVIAMMSLPAYLKFYNHDVSEEVLIFASIIIAANLVNILSGPVGLFAQLSNIRERYLIANVLAVLLSLSASFMLVPYGGVLALSVITFVVAILWNAFIYVSIYKKYGIKI